MKVDVYIKQGGTAGIMILSRQIKQGEGLFVFLPLKHHTFLKRGTEPCQKNKSLTRSILKRAKCPRLGTIFGQI
jgi:hypothetical protein